MDRIRPLVASRAVTERVTLQLPWHPRVPNVEMDLAAR